MKGCSRCRRNLADSEFYPRADRGGRLSSHCRSCQNAYARSNYGAAQKTKRRAHSKRWYLENREHRLAVAREWLSKNKERVRINGLFWRLFNGEAIAARSAIYRASRREKIREWAKAYNLRTRRQSSQRWANRKARKLNATPAWADHNAIAGFYKNAREMTDIMGIGYAVDHIVPLVSHLVCGLHWEGNLQVITGRANSAKGNRIWPDMP